MSEPVLRIVRGDATPEEIAALVAVIAAATGAATGAGKPLDPEPRSAWADPARRVRAVHHPGPGAWRASGLPR